MWGLKWVVMWGYHLDQTMEQNWATAMENSSDSALERLNKYKIQIFKIFVNLNLNSNY